MSEGQTYNYIKYLCLLYSAIQGLNVKETINLVLTKFTDETLSISIGLMGLLFVILIAYWIYYRRKFNELKHQIPAQVVKNYLDSIIQNSSALKSSLFRGGGLDIEDGIPSVVPTSELRGTPVSVSGVSSEELNQKNAEIAALKGSISDKDKTISELEKKLGDSSGAPAPDNSAEISSLKTKITELEAALAAAGSAAGSSDDGELTKKLTEVTQERDQLKEKLQEYEIIEEDLANLKRLQQENEQLKKALEAGGGAMPAAEPEAEPEADPLPVEAVEEADPLPVEEPAAENDPDPLPVDEPDPLPVDEPEPLPVDDASASDSEMGVPANEGEQKSAEELLSEFEKMLG